MIKQTLFFSSPVSLSLKYNQIVISIAESKEIVTRPIEDVGVVIVENQMVQLTIPLLNALAENNVAVIFCDGKSMPCSILTSLNANSTQQEVHRVQIDASVATKKRLWKEIVEHKIRNQASLLDILGYNGDVLRPYWSNVLSGDSNNREGAAAKVYWKELYGRRFVRDRNGDAPNALLNYGYSILRAAVARALLGSGLYLGFGLFHRNRYNAFPLADDVMEPYRPFVDCIVCDIYRSGANVGLNKETKQMLVKVLTTDVKMDEQVRPLQIALSSTTASLVRALKDRKESIEYPSFV